MSKPINIYSTPDLRQTLDEALPTVFSRLGYTQSFRLIDMKLAIGYSIAVVAGVSFILDKKMKFDEALTYQKLLVVAYMILSTVFWYFTKHIEKGVTFSGSSGKDNITVVTKMKKYSSLYEVAIEDKAGKTVNVELPVNKVFNAHGFLQQDLLFEWYKQQMKLLAEKKEQ